jgi:hypothetical protein
LHLCPAPPSKGAFLQVIPERVLAPHSILEILSLVTYNQLLYVLPNLFSSEIFMISSENSNPFLYLLFGEISF